MGLLTPDNVLMNEGQMHQKLIPKLNNERHHTVTNLRSQARSTINMLIMATAQQLTEIVDDLRDVLDQRGAVLGHEHEEFYQVACDFGMGVEELVEHLGDDDREVGLEEAFHVHVDSDYDDDDLVVVDVLLDHGV